MLIGLTGGIASGKSTVSEMLKRRGAHVIDFDVLARIVVEPDKPAWRDIVDYFGDSVLNEDHTLNRTKLGDIVFADAEKRQTLQGFIYPRLYEEYARQINEIQERHPDAIIVVDIPLLIETGMRGTFEKIIVVYATKEQQIKRLMARDGLDRESIQKRLDAQMSIDEKVKYADYVISNSDSLEQTEANVEQVWRDLLNLQREKQEPSS